MSYQHRKIKYLPTILNTLVINSGEFYVESREPSRTMLFVGVISLDAFLVCIIMLNLRANINSLSYWFSILAGIGLGILSCLYLRAVWDPVYLKLKNPNARTADHRWMPIAVIGGVLFARLVLDQLSSEIGTALVNIGLVWVIVSLSYMGFQAWWHRSR